MLIIILSDKSQKKTAKKTPFLVIFAKASSVGFVPDILPILTVSSEPKVREKKIKKYLT